MNKQIRLKQRPQGLTTAADFHTVVSPTPELKTGEVLVKTVFLSVDVPLRLLLEHDIPLDGGMFLPKVRLGEVVTAFGTGVVVESKNPNISVGTRMGGLLGLQEYTVVKSNPFNHALPDGVPLDVALNGLGNTGMTAYFGFFDLGKPKAGETVLVSAAAGSVGVIVCQLAKIAGCRVIGLAGSDAKVRWLLDEVGADAACNYKSEGLDARLAQLCPEGVNLYFDNVGGTMLDTVLGRMAKHSRVVACGTMGEGEPGTWGGIHRLYISLLSKRIQILGLNASDFIVRYAEAGKELMAWSGEGRLRWFDTVIEGLDRAAPEALNMLFTGGNKGKLLVRVAND
jgi:NADPH-dependent curcumin reductase CurA